MSWADLFGSRRGMEWRFPDEIADGSHPEWAPIEHHEACAITLGYNACTCHVFEDHADGVA